MVVINMKIIEKEHGIYINNPTAFLAVSNLKYSDGINVIENVNIIKKDSKEINHNNSDITHIADYDNYFIKEYGCVTIITFMDNDVIIEDFFKDLKVANSPKGFADARINLSHVIHINKKLSTKNLIELYKNVADAKSKFFTNLNLPFHINNILNTNDFLVIMANNTTNEEYVETNIKDLNIEESVEITLEEAFKKLKLTFGILDYLVAEGIQIGDLVEAGMDLLNVEVTEELNQKLESQILKSLNDTDVIAILMTAMELEQNLTANKIREINIFTELYTGKLLGLAISNQIAGTKAAFNFKYYNEAKPGIIYGLPPILDDVFAGLIAGCVSKIF